MPKKNMTDAEKKAFGAKMKAARQAKKGLEGLPKELTTPDPNEGTVASLDLENGRTKVLEETVEGLKRQLDELLASRAQTPQDRPGFSQGGDLVGSFEKYSVEEDYYPSPVDRLAKEPRLRQYWIRSSEWTEETPLNYELDYSISTTGYQTIDGVRVKEPKFTIKLVRVIPDEETGQPTDRRYVICTGIFHEDPDAAIEVARRNQIVVDESNQRSFLNEMRYLRMRDWLLEAFYGAKPDPTQNKQETVIGNRLVEIYSVSTEAGESTPKIPFGEMTRKL